MGDVEAALTAELAKLDQNLRDGTLAATGLVLARQLDTERVSATAKSMCARALQEVLDKLRELAPPAAEEDRIDEIGARRSARRRSSGT